MVTVFNPKSGGFESRRDSSDPNVGKETVKNIVEQRGTSDSTNNNNRYSGGGRSNRKETTQPTQTTEVKETPEVIKQITKPQPTIQELYKQKQEQLQKQQSVQPKPNYLSQVQPTSKKKEFEEYIKDKNPVRATKEAVIETVTAELSKREKGQNLFGKPEVKTGIGLGLYFVPVLGQTLLIAEGVGQFTNSGRKEAQQIGEQVKQKTGLPKEVGEYGTYGLSTFGLFAGGSSAISKIASKTTKYDTTFIGTATQKTDDIISTQSKAFTSESNLFWRKNYLTDINTVTKDVGAIDDTSNVYVSGSKGVTREIKYTLPYKENNLGKPQSFLSAESSIATKGDNELTRIMSFGKSQAYKKDVSYYANLGYARKTGDYTYYVGKGRLIDVKNNVYKPSTTQITSRGIVKDSENEITIVFNDINQLKKTQLPKALIEQQQKNAIVSAIKSAKPTPKPFRPVPLVTPLLATREETISVTSQQAVSQVMRNENKMFSSDQNKLNDKTQTSISPLLDQTKSEISNAYNTKADIIVGTKSESKSIDRTINNNLFAQSQPQKDEVKTISSLGITNILRQRQEQLQNQKQNLSNKFNPLARNVNRFALPILTRPKASESKKDLLLSKLKKAYNVIGRRFGKDIIIGKGLPEGKARKLAVKNVLSNLGRSFKIEEAGFTEDEDVYYKTPLNLFRPSKTKKGWLVQRNALSNRMETNEIQMFKRKSNKGGKFKLWNMN